MVLGYIPQLNNVAHVGGFLAGICCGLVLLPRIQPPRGIVKAASGGDARVKQRDLVARVLFLVGVVGMGLIYVGGIALLASGGDLATPAVCKTFLSVSC